MPPRAKKSASFHDRQAPSHVNNSHSLGLAPPGRRIPKQTRPAAPSPSSSAVSGRHSPTAGTSGAASANGHVRSTAIVQCADDSLTGNELAPPAFRLESHATTHACRRNHHYHDTPDDDTSPDANDLVSHTSAKMGAGQSCDEGRGRAASSASSLGDLESATTAADTPAFARPSRSASLTVGGAGKCSQRQPKTSLALATTILSSCPLWDVIAILIILLQLPPTIISIVHFLFAALTFVAPTTNASLSNLPSVNEILLGSGGAPSLQTIIIVDFFMLIAFVSAWLPVQNFALDLAQAVIAISLGGAAAHKGGTSNSIFCCLSIIGVSHLYRWRSARRLGFGLIWELLVKLGVRPEGAVPDVFTFSPRSQSSPGMLRRILGVHILTQGLVRLVRRWYLYRAVAEAPAAKRVDPDVGSLGAQGEDVPADTTDVGGSGDGRPPGPSPSSGASVAQNTREKSTKKKKKQANHVRSQQPFWAALASTKITVLKEYELQQASLDALEANAEDVAHIGNADFKNIADRVWVTDVGAASIAFGVALREEEEDDKPFRVRVNQTEWSSTRIKELGPVGDDGVHLWAGEIFGLTASTNYVCDFVRPRDGAVIYTVHATTQPAPSTEQAAPPALPAQKSLDPLSPTTTLKNSITAAEQTLDASRTRLKRNKKEHKNAVSALQQNIKQLSQQLSSNTNNDDRQRQKVRQFEQSITQAYKKESEVLAQIDEIKDQSAEEALASKATREAWLAAKKQQREQREELAQAKAKAERSVAQARTELTTLVQRRQKFEARQTKYNEQAEGLRKAATEGKAAQERRFKERDAEFNRRLDTERRFLDQTAVLEQEYRGCLARISKLEQQAKLLEDMYVAAQSQIPLSQSHPSTPDGPIHLRGGSGPPVSLPPSSLASFPAYAAYQFPGMSVPPGLGHSPEQVHPRSAAASISSAQPPASFVYQDLPPPRTRARSSSMLSGVSGFTDLDDPAPAALEPAYAFSFPTQPQQSGQAPIGHGRRRKGSSESSGSGGSGGGTMPAPVPSTRYGIPRPATGHGYGLSYGGYGAAEFGGFSTGHHLHGPSYGTLNSGYANGYANGFAHAQHIRAAGTPTSSSSEESEVSEASGSGSSPAGSQRDPLSPVLQTGQGKGVLTPPPPAEAEV
ncbi:hypothetical protein EJ06DRAFT_582616 [Trichodelitschia bisporula]|uniref:Ubiquitination network signaling protein n=1 Tax=Trichodelitschia bisporula TaxID=703511 RepID=A0A6G1HW03_9PEZI|nr:hypothetical protein EJ06DRAFT_582616 [Trichodelitschia bisporula]